VAKWPLFSVVVTVIFGGVLARLQPSPTLPQASGARRGSEINLAYEIPQITCAPQRPEGFAFVIAPIKGVRSKTRSGRKSRFATIKGTSTEKTKAQLRRFMSRIGAYVRDE